jgi:hypothetical protein
MTEGQRYITPAEAIFQKLVERRFSETTNSLLEIAEKDAKTRLSRNAGPLGEKRIKNGLVNCLGPYLEEISKLADQRETQEYTNSANDITTFLGGVKIATVGCSDRRIGHSAITLPQVGTGHRRPGGVAEFRESTANPDDKKFVMNDHVIAASIGYTAEIQKEKGKQPKFYEKILLHIDCAAGKKAACKKAEDEQKPIPEGEELEMQSIEGLLEKMRDSMSGFNTDIKRAGGKELTVISLFDIHSQGEIYGLEYVFDEKRAKGQQLFDRSKSLPQNFDEWENEGKILRTATLDKKLLTDNPELADIKTRIDEDPSLALNIQAPEHHANSMVKIADVTKILTERYENGEGFNWIPAKLREEIQDPDLLRTIAFDMIRNSVRRILGRIEPGNHDRLKHPERLTRIGSTGGALNEQTPAFIISTPGGELRPQDKEAAKIKIPLQAHVAEELGVDLTKEAQIVVVTEEYDADDYNPAKPDIARKAYHEKASLAKYNAAEVRNLFTDKVKNGDIVVIAALHDRKRRMVEVLSSLPQEERPQD